MQWSEADTEASYLTNERLQVHHPESQKSPVSNFWNFVPLQKVLSLKASLFFCRSSKWKGLSVRKEWFLAREHNLLINIKDGIVNGAAACSNDISAE